MAAAGDSAKTISLHHHIVGGDLVNYKIVLKSLPASYLSLRKQKFQLREEDVFTHKK